jgi:hypothetical protein
MLVPAREQTVNLSQGLIDFISTLAPGAVTFLKREVGGVIFVGISSVCPGSTVDLLFCVLLHPLCSGVLAGLVIPIALVDECLLGWERHVLGIAMLLFGLGDCLQWLSQWFRGMMLDLYVAETEWHVGSTSCDF